MAPRWDSDLKSKRRSKVYYEGDQKTMSEKWCFHPYHQGINKAKRKRGKLTEYKFKSFPHVNRHNSAFIALSHNDTKVIKQLLQEGKCRMRQNRCNCTLLQLAARNDCKEIVRLLHNAVDPNAVNRFGQTAAHIVALQGNTDMLKLLLSFDHFDPEVEDMWNNTYKDNLAAPLFTAVLWSDIDHIEELLELGADPDDHAGKLVEGIVAQELKVSTPRELAIALNRNSIVDKCPKPTLQKTWPSVPIKSHMPKPQYKNTTKGFVSIFSYDSFNGRPDLSSRASENDANHLAKVFSHIGYNGDIYSSLSAEETLKALGDIR